MAKCKRCGRGGLFFRVGPDGLCANCASLVQLEVQRGRLQTDITALEVQLNDRQITYDRLAAEARAEGLRQASEESAALDRENRELEATIQNKTDSLQTLLAEVEKTKKSTASAGQKLYRLRQLIKSAQHAADEFDNGGELDRALAQSVEQELEPVVELNLQCMGMRELRKRYNQNQKQIRQTYERYKSRYTTKTNMAIYQLMTIALEAELQNILNNIGFGKLDSAIDSIKKMTARYYEIAAAGNQAIAPTIKKYIGEMEYFFIEAVKIEYEYYVQRERAREEQRAIREQMRQEAAERRELERQRLRMEKEETKYKAEIETVRQQLAAADAGKTQALQLRIEQLEAQLAATADKREEILKRQNGKAGYVYIISNIGSFGEDVFKVGMTRRMEPQERVNELGDASVPFPFDVHSFIFSDDAVDLESSMHHILNDRRVNKVNLRKEFFRVSLDELEDLVYKLDPTAEFKRTILATQFRQSQSIDHVPEGNPEDNAEADRDADEEE